MTAYEVHGDPVAWKRAQHATASSYRNGCRCEPCRVAGSVANAAARARRKVWDIEYQGQVVGVKVEEGS